MSETNTIEAEEIPGAAVQVRDNAVPAPITEQRAITPAQAKVDAVAALTMSAYARAATLELTGDEAAALQADFPDEAFQPGAAGKEHLIYIEHAHLRDRFNSVFGMGKWAIVPRNRWAEAFKTQRGDDGSRVYVEAMLVVRGCFVGEAVGAMEYYPKNASQNYGDAVEGAKTAAFRRCAKEFGVGLQAWKKEFCEGWWQRKRAPKTAAPSRQAPAAPTPFPSKPQVATEAFRTRMLEQLVARPGEANREIVTEYFVKCGQILSTEQLEDLPLRFVPASKSQMDALAGKLAEFGNGEQAARAFTPNDGPEPPSANKNPAQSKPAPARGVPVAPKDDEAWRDVIVPVPRKGEKRDQYLKSPDTIGSLFDLRHGSDDESQAVRQRLWGFVHNYEAKPWTGQDGKQRPPSAADVKFREALDQFADWFERNHPDEKL